MEDDEGRREEFRQLLKSYMRFYSFVAQIIRLGDTELEKLFSLPEAQGAVANSGPVPSPGA